MAGLARRRAIRCRDHYRERIREARSSRSALAAASDWVRAEAMKADEPDRHDVINALVDAAEKLNGRRGAP